MTIHYREQEASELKAHITKASGMIAAAVAVASAGALACPAYAFAAEGGVQAILPKMNEFIPMLVAFIILWIVLAKFGWPAFDKMLKKREDTIRQSIESSEAARIESERVLEEYKAQLADAKNQAAEIIAEAKKTGEAVKADITDKAMKEADAMIAKAKDAIEAEKKQAISELQASAADLSVNVAGRVIGEDLTDEEHMRIVERYLAEAGSINAN
jgi:F-type H+-transporting ATPase subunit b